VGYYLTKRIFGPLSDLRRMVRADMRPTYRHYRDGISFHRLSRNWSVEARTSWILTNLRRTLRRAAETTPYYRQLFNDVGFDPRSDFGFDDFASLPILNRDDIADAGDRMLSTDVDSDQRLPDSSGGSTGKPTQIWTGPEERGWSESTMQFSFEKLGLDSGSRTAFLWGHHLDPGESDSFTERVKYFARNEKYLDCFRLSPERMTRFHKELDRYAPDCLVAYASSLALFSEFLEEQGIGRPSYPKKCIVTGAEKLYAHHREQIEGYFQTPVYERYGGRDYGLLAIQTGTEPENRVFEIDWTWAIVEPESESAQSSVLVTKLHADAMPMIRYRVGDIASFPVGSKPGHPAFVLNDIVGRELDTIWLPTGESLSGAQFPHLLKSFAVREFMFIQEKDYSVELKIVPKPGFTGVEQAEIEQVVALNLRGVPLRVRLVDDIERTRANKWRPVISKVRH
jgi:phenylacetate-CoA ligase